MQSRRKGWLTVGTITLTILCALAAWRSWFPGTAFDPAVWHDEAHVKQGARLQMADRLIARQALLGRTRAKVVTMLGEPPETAYFANWDLVYWLGPERGLMSIDSEWLVMRLGHDGKVVESRIVRD